MLVKGDVKCLHCGFVSGTWVGPKGSPVLPSGFSSREPSPETAPDPSSPVRCGRCDGPVFLEDLEPVISGYRLRRIQRLRQQLAALDDTGRAA